MDTPPSTPTQTLPPVPRITFRALCDLLVETGKSWIGHRAQTMGAALSYYTTFSLAPLVVFLFSVASLAVQKREASAKIVQEVRSVMGEKGAEAVQEILKHAGSTQTASWGTALSFIVLMIGATGAFGELQDSLNTIWEVSPQKHPLLTIIKERALSFAMIFVLGFFILVSLVLTAVVQGVGRAIGFELTNTALSFVIFSGLFSIMFRLLPDVPLKWSDVWFGAIFSSVLFIVGKFLLGWYIGISSATFSRYGAAGSFIVIMVWVFYSAQILFLGAEFTRAYTFKFGSHRGEKPEPDAAATATPREASSRKSPSKTPSS